VIKARSLDTDGSRMPRELLLTSRLLQFAFHLPVSSYRIRQAGTASVRLLRYAGSTRTNALGAKDCQAIIDKSI